MPIQQTAAPASQTTVQMDRPIGRGAADREKMLMQASSQGIGQLPPQSVVNRERDRICTLDPQEGGHASNIATTCTLFIAKLQIEY